MLAGALAPAADEKGAAEGWQLLKDRPEPPKSGEFFGRGVHALAGGPDLEYVSWIEGTLDSKTFRDLSFRKQPVSPPRQDAYFTIDELGYAKVTIAIDAISLFEVLAPAHSRRVELFEPTREQRDRVKEPTDGSAVPAYSFFAWGKISSQVVNGREELSGISAVGCFEDYQIRKGLTDCYDVAPSAALPVAPLRLGNMTAQRVRACVKPTTYKTWKLSPSNGYLLDPFQFLSEMPTPADIYEVAFIGENGECTAVEAGSFAPLPMNTEWAKLPDAKEKRPVLCSFVHGDSGNARLLMDVIPPDPDYASARLGDLLAGAGALEVGLEGAPPLWVQSANKLELSKGAGAVKFDGVSGYAAFNEGSQVWVVVREKDSGVTLRSATPVDLPKNGVFTFWIGGDWAQRSAPASELRPRLVVCDDLAPGGPLLSCSASIDLELQP